jgi:soluble lytic murein transglycosylase-like protein
MQNAASTSYRFYICTTGEAQTARQQSPRSFPRITLLAGLLLMGSLVPEAGLVPATEIAPLDGAAAYEELSVEEVAAHFEKRLGAPYKQDSLKLARVLLQLCDQHQFSPTFLLSVIETESTFRVNVISKAGAVGLMQLLPATAREMSEKYKIAYKGEADLHNPAVNMKLGVAYLSWLRRQFGHSLHYVAAYNLGPTALRRRLASGDYELGAMERYVRTIHERTRSLRDSRGVAVPAIHRAAGADTVMAAAL